MGKVSGQVGAAADASPTSCLGRARQGGKTLPDPTWDPTGRLQRDQMPFLLARVCGPLWGSPLWSGCGISSGRL